MNWQKNLKGKVKIAEPLYRHTAFKIGGAAKFFVEPKNIADLKLLIKAAKRYKIPFFIIGAGSNILASDAGLRGIVAHLESADFSQLTFKGNTVKAGAGLVLKQLLLGAQRHSLSGLEFLAGIPGTVGGALAMNAGSAGKSIGDLVKKVKVMDYNGKVKTLGSKKIKFGYRHSNLGQYIILDASLRLKKGKKSQIQSQIKKLLAYRRKKQDYSLPSAGCVFKNSAKQSAGRLIDLCGLKGKSYGSALISQKHANFILNKGDACFQDVLKLMDLAKREVKKRFKISLKPEIKIWQ